MDNGQLVLTVFEGRLEKILVLNGGNLEKFLINLSLNLPGKVFNQNRLAEMAETVKARYGLKNVEWKLVKKPDEQRSATVQLPDVTGGYFFSDKASPYELQIILKRGDSSRRGGPGFGARMMLPKGFNPYAYYKDYDLMLDNDEWRTSMEFGLYYTTKMNRPAPTITAPHKGWENVEPLLTYAGVDGYYYFPQWWDFLRIGPELTVDLTTRGRADLPLDLYRDFAVKTAWNFDFQVTGSLRIIPGFGFDYHSIFGINEVPEQYLTADQNPFHLNPYWEWRFFPRLKLDLNTGKEYIRLDRGHRATWEYLYRHGSSGNHYHLFRGDWKYTWDIGYDEVTPRIRGVGTVGDMPFYDNLPLSSYAFKASTSHYVEKHDTTERRVSPFPGARRFQDQLFSRRSAFPSLVSAQRRPRRWSKPSGCQSQHRFRPCLRPRSACDDLGHVAVRHLRCPQLGLQRKQGGQNAGFLAVSSPCIKCIERVAWEPFTAPVSSDRQGWNL